MLNRATDSLAGFLSPGFEPRRIYVRRRSSVPTLLAAAGAFYARQAARESAATHATLRDVDANSDLDPQQEYNEQMLELQQQILQTQQQMLHAQQQSAWFAYRQTSEGRAFEEWAARALPMLEQLDALNTEWLAASVAAAREAIPQPEFDAEEQCNYSPFLPPEQRGWKADLRTVFGAVEEDETGRRIPARFAQIRQQLHERRVAYFGYDPVFEPDALPPGWGVGNTNWLLAAEIREVVDNAYTSYPDRAALPDLEWPQLANPDEIKPPQMAPLLADWKARGHADEPQAVSGRHL